MGPGLSSLDGLVTVIKRYKKPLAWLAIAALLLFVFIYYSEHFNFWRMLNKQQEEKLAVYPEPQRSGFRAFLNDVINSGWDVTITSGVRYNGNDPHTRKHALDLNARNRVTGEVLKMDSPKERWLKSGLPDIGKRHGLRWGGNFKTPYYFNGVLRSAYDPVHFDFE